ncbi:lipase [Vibrio harveyi]|uniref:lipase n=1 Tax=Vibrio TaxID=662 RepID=UPI0022CD3A70|nr:lipase [Vibrio sp. MM46]MDA0121596.1 lipase [Vibrio sp. MM46]
MGSFALRYKPSVNYPEQPLSPQNMSHGVMIIDDYSSRCGSILQALSGCYSWLFVILWAEWFSNALYCSVFKAAQTSVMAHFQNRSLQVNWNDKDRLWLN